LVVNGSDFDSDLDDPHSVCGVLDTEFGMSVGVRSDQLTGVRDGCTPVPGLLIVLPLDK